MSFVTPHLVEPRHAATQACFGFRLLIRLCILSEAEIAYPRRPPRGDFWPSILPFLFKLVPPIYHHQSQDIQSCPPNHQVSESAHQDNDVDVVSHSFSAIIASKASLTKHSRSTLGLAGGIIHLVYIAGFLVTKHSSIPRALARRWYLR